MGRYDNNNVIIVIVIIAVLPLYYRTRVTVYCALR